MAETANEFSLESGLSSLNEVFAFPPEKQFLVIQCLRVAQRLLPSVSDYDQVRRKGGSWEESKMECLYGGVADIYAKTIDPNYDCKLGVGYPNEETLRYRGKFYEMIRYLTRENIEEGLKSLEKYFPSA